jgi:hypothetical protein
VAKKPFKTLPDGSRIEKVRGGYDAYDAAGRYLGNTKDVNEAQCMAENGFMNRLDDVADLSLWCMWQDAINSGETPVQAEDGTQFLSLPDGIVMSAKRGDHGPEVALLRYEDFYLAHKHPTFSILALKYTAQPLVLE